VGDKGPTSSPPRPGDPDLLAVLDELTLAVSAFEPRRDDEGRIVDFVWRYMNSRARASMPAALGELLGHGLLERLTGHNRALFESYVEAYDNGVPYVEVFDFRTPDLSGFFEIHASRVRDLLVVQYSDVTARVELDAARAAARQAVDEALGRISDAVFAVDLEWRFTYVNAQAAKLLGRPAAHLLGRELWQEFPRALGSRFERSYRQAMATGRAAGFEEYYPAPLDTWYSVQAYPGAEGLTVYFRDVGARRRMEQSVAQLERLESAAALAGGIAHDFNNLLMVVSGHAALLGAQLDGDHPGQGDVAAISAAARRATELTQQLLRFGRGQFVRTELVDLAEAAARVEANLGDRLGADLRLVCIAAPGEVFVEVDPDEVDRALGHLAANALDAMPDGGTLTIEVSVATVAERDPVVDGELPVGRYGVVTVADDGIGMGASVRARATEPFFSTRRAEGAAGLGLSAVHGMARQAAGGLLLYSEPGVGTTARLYLPLVAPAEARSGDEVEPVVEGADLRGSEAILVVDDDLDVRELLGGILTGLGYQVTLASGARDAIEVLSTEAPPPALVVTDMVMPDGDGHDVAAAAVAQDPPVRVLYVSGFTRSSVIARRAAGDGVHFLAKPFSAHDLAVRVRSLLDNR
jgi:signal transduction histidine kinase